MKENKEKESNRKKMKKTLALTNNPCPLSTGNPSKDMGIPLVMPPQDMNRYDCDRIERRKKKEERKRNKRKRRKENYGAMKEK